MKGGEAAAQCCRHLSWSLLPAGRRRQCPPLPHSPPRCRHCRSSRSSSPWDELGGNLWYPRPPLRPPSAHIDPSVSVSQVVSMAQPCAPPSAPAPRAMAWTPKPRYVQGGFVSLPTLVPITEAAGDASGDLAAGCSFGCAWGGSWLHPILSPLWGWRRKLVGIP